MRAIAMITVGQSPRDDLVPHMEAVFSRKVEIWQGGVLDGLGGEAIADLWPDPGEVGIVARLRDGSNTMLSHRKILSRVQALVDEAVARGASLIVILCGADWSALRSSTLIVNPGRIFPAIVWRDPCNLHPCKVPSPSERPRSWSSSIPSRRT